MAKRRKAAGSRNDSSRTIAIAATVGTVVGAIVTSLFQYAGRSQELDIRMIEIGLSILRAPPSDDISKIRSWALDVIEKRSGMTFTPLQRQVLEQKALPFAQLDGPYFRSFARASDLLRAIGDLPPPDQYLRSEGRATK